MPQLVTALYLLQIVLLSVAFVVAFVSVMFIVFFIVKQQNRALITKNVISNKGVLPK